MMLKIDFLSIIVLQKTLVESQKNFQRIVKRFQLRLVEKIHFLNSMGRKEQ